MTQLIFVEGENLLLDLHWQGRPLWMKSRTQFVLLSL